MTGSKYGSALAVRQEVAEYLRPPRRMPVAEPSYSIRPE